MAGTGVAEEPFSGAGARAGSGMWAGILGRAGGRRGWRDFMSFTTRRVISRNAGRMPSPRLATVSNSGASKRLSWARSSSTGTTPGRSRLLYWRTRGNEARSIPISARLASRFDIDSMFESAALGCESATKTTPSAPLSTATRVRS